MAHSAAADKELSGGSTHIALTHEPIDVGGLISRCTAPECGAVSSFLGTTRNSFHGRPVTTLRYTAYESMALKELAKVVQSAREGALALPQQPHGSNALHHVAVEHRLGEVPVGEVSVAIVVSSPHRAASLWAVQHIIDTLKARVPVWKQEFFQGEAQGTWKSNAECGCGGGGAGPPLVRGCARSPQEPDTALEAPVEHK